MESSDFMNYEEFILFLKSKSDLKYKKFHSNLIKDNNLIGIRTPLLKEIAKEISKNDYLNFIKRNKHKYYEENILHGLVLGYIKVDDEMLLKLIDDFLPFNNNWAVNDLTVTNLKAFKKIPFEKVLGYIESKNDFTIRFGLVLLLTYYISDENIDKILNICDSIKNNNYYVQMANAWLISICFIKQKSKTYSYLKNNTLDEFTFKKAINKICDSYRVDKNEKIKLKKLLESRGE